jgi:hypothetical protein
MKIFWSWQSDTPKDIGRFFVRDALREAIQVLKTDEHVLEPLERETAAKLELDSDRQGVPGSPDLAATIFDKIEAADVFVADVTIVGATPEGKKLINSNVAIEYGHAHKALSFRRVLMVQNHHYGDGDDLPFDLRQKSWPLHYTLAPDATKAEISAERAKFKAKLAEALRPYLSMGSAAAPTHVGYRRPSPGQYLPSDRKSSPKITRRRRMRSTTGSMEHVHSTCGSSPDSREQTSLS